MGTMSAGILQKLFAHQWKELARSVLWLRTMAGSLFSGILLLLLALNFLAIGLGIHLVLKDIEPDKAPSEVFNGVLLYFFLISFLFRQLFQRIPYQALNCYLTLPVPRSKLVHAFLIRSFLSFFNLFPLLVFTPVAFNVVAVDHSIPLAMTWLATLITLVLGNSLLTFYLNKQVAVRPLLLLATVTLVILLLVADYYELWSLSEGSRFLFSTLLAYPVLILIPLGIVLGLYLASFRFLLSHTYLDEVGGSTAQLVIRPVS
ncbi:MAG: hypothetical protein JSU96_16355, partial [Acidobacteriota bacterium]